MDRRQFIRDMGKTGTAGLAILAGVSITGTCCGGEGCGPQGETMTVVCPPLPPPPPTDCVWEWDPMIGDWIQISGLPGCSPPGFLPADPFQAVGAMNQCSPPPPAGPVTCTWEWTGKTWVLKSGPAGCLMPPIPR